MQVLRLNFVAVAACRLIQLFIDVGKKKILLAFAIFGAKIIATHHNFFGLSFDRV